MLKKRYSPRKTARKLKISESSLDVLRRRDIIHPLRQGRLLFYPEGEIERVLELHLDSIWPPKQHGKTTRHFAPVEKKAPVKADLDSDERRNGAA